MNDSVLDIASKAPKTYWNSHWEKYQPAVVSTVLFADLFKAYLPKDPGMRCLEIGCVPGEFLSYFHNNFRYEVHGVDYSDQLEVVEKVFSMNEVSDYRLYKADFLTWAPDTLYDVVMSFGFVEHFINYEEIIRKHIALVAPGGWLVITMPNFKYVQYFLHRLCDKKNLDRHNVAAMNVKRLRSVLTDGGMEIHKLGYYGTFDFWAEQDRRSEIQKWIARNMLRVASELRYVVRHRKINWPTPWFSPYIVSVSQKKQTAVSEERLCKATGAIS